LSVSNDELRAQYERMQEDYKTLQKSEESTRQERDDAAEALAEAQAAYSALLGAHEASTRELQRLENVYEGLRREREEAADALEKVLRRLLDR